MVLLVCFIIVAALLILLIVIQDDGENGMGGLLGGRGTAAFGSHSASVLTKTTAVLVVIFFGLSVGLAIVNKKPTSASVLEGAKVEEINEIKEENKDWFSNAEGTTPAVESTETTETAPAAEATTVVTE